MFPGGEKFINKMSKQKAEPTVQNVVSFARLLP